VILYYLGTVRSTENAMINIIASPAGGGCGVFPDKKSPANQKITDGPKTTEKQNSLNTIS
jgi:hypothetical protein